MNLGVSDTTGKVARELRQQGLAGLLQQVSGSHVPSVLRVEAMVIELAAQPGVEIGQGGSIQPLAWFVNNFQPASLWEMAPAENLISYSEDRADFHWLHAEISLL